MIFLLSDFSHNIIQLIGTPYTEGFPQIYEGQSIYKVSCAVVFIVFLNNKFQDIHFVGNLIYNIC